MQKLLTRTLEALLGLGLLALVAAGVFVATSLESLSHLDLGADLELAEPLRVYSADGLLMGEFGTERRYPVPLAEVPEPLIQAFLAAEDARFYAHPGVDLRGLARAAWRYALTGVPAEGGSTITMQLARTFLLTREKTFERKLLEILLAIQLERTLSKDRILSLYLNGVFFGQRAYGVAAAAAVYYDKPLADLTLAESAMLAAIPKAPSTDNPVANPRRARARRDHILERMGELGFIDAASRQEALAAPDRAGRHQPVPELDAGHAAEWVRQDLVARFGPAAYRQGYRVTTTLEGGLQRQAQRAVRGALIAYDRRHGYRGPEGRLTGPLDAATMQARLEQMDSVPGLRAGIVRHADSRRAEVVVSDGALARLDLRRVQWARPHLDPDREGPAPRRVDAVLHPGDLIRLRQLQGGGWELAQRPAVAAALLALAPRDGAIRALVGGYQFGPDQFNRAMDARRQPGSAFKPFIYAAALAAGWTPASLILDAPITLSQGRGLTWTPGNADGRALGPIRLRRALTLSRNLASIDLLDRLGLDQALAFLPRFGFAPADLPRNLTLTLGTGDVTLPQLAGAYAVFANGGFQIRPYLIDRIQDGSGALVFQAEPPLACAGCWFADPEPAAAAPPVAPPEDLAPRVLEPWVSYQIHSILQDVVNTGTARAARALGRTDLAGKTGTTNEIRDAWFCGYQRDLVAVAWLGFDTPAPLGRGESGGESALGLWMGFMGEALRGRPEAQPQVPEGMVQVWVNPESGDPVKPDTPGAIPEWVRTDDPEDLAGPKPVTGSSDPPEEPPSMIEAVY